MVAVRRAPVGDRQDHGGSLHRVPDLHKSHCLKSINTVGGGFASSNICPHSKTLYRWINATRQQNSLKNC